MAFGILLSAFNHGRRTGLVAAACIMSGCSPGTDRTRPDSVATAVTGGEPAPERLASDATLTLFNSVRLAVPLRAAADSFAAREAVSIDQESVDSASQLGDQAEAETTPDVIALAVDDLAREVVSGRTSWYIEFARDTLVLALPDSSRKDTARQKANDSLDNARANTLSSAAITFAVSIPVDARNPRVAERFLRFLFSDEGRQTLRAAQLDILDAPVVVGADVPPTILASLGRP